MKGAYSSPSAVLGKLSQLSLYPDTTYGVNSGGDPKAIPDLTYDYFKNFHAKFYHPSNARMVFYGDDDPAKRLEMLDDYLQPVRRRIDRGRYPAAAALERAAADRTRPMRRARPSPARRPPWSPSTGCSTRSTDPETVLALNVLESILVGTPAAPLRKAMIDSGLGEGLTGSGFADGIRQPYFTFGLKGIDEADGGKVEALIIETLRKAGKRRHRPAHGRSGDELVRVRAARKQHRLVPARHRADVPLDGHLALWRRSADAAQLRGTAVGVETPAGQRRAGVRDADQDHILDNRTAPPCCSRPIRARPQREAAEERARLDAAQRHARRGERAEVAEQTRQLKALQEAGDPPEALSKIPTLTLSDLPRTNKPIPIVHGELAGVALYTHDLPTNGVIYLDLGFDLKALPGRLLPYLPLFTRALTQTGTSQGRFRLAHPAHRPLHRRRRRQPLGDQPARRQWHRGAAVHARQGHRRPYRRHAVDHDRRAHRRAARQPRAHPGRWCWRARPGSRARSPAWATASSRCGCAPASTRPTGSTRSWAASAYYFFLRDLAAQIDGDWPSGAGGARVRAHARHLLIGRAARWSPTSPPIRHRDAQAGSSRPSSRPAGGRSAPPPRAGGSSPARCRRA